MKEDIKREEEEAGFVKGQFQTIREFLEISGSKKICTKYLKERLREILGYEYGVIMREALKVANEYGRNRMKSLWDYNGEKMFEPSAEYFVPTKRVQTFKSRCKVNIIWKKYEVSESGRISIFSLMERIKLVYASVLQNVNINYLISGQYVK